MLLPVEALEPPFGDDELDPLPDGADPLVPLLDEDELELLELLDPLLLDPLEELPDDEPPPDGLAPNDTAVQHPRMTTKATHRRFMQRSFAH